MRSGLRPALSPIRRSPAAPAALAALALALAAPAARAEAPTFIAEVDRNQVAPGDVFTYTVTLSVGNNQVGGFRPPDFKGFQVVGAPRGPNQSTQMQIGGSGMFVQKTLSWPYQLAPAAGQKGTLAIGPAHAQVDGRDVKSNVVNVRVDPNAAPAAPPQPQQPFGGLFPPMPQPQPPPPRTPAAAPPPLSSASAANFVRAVADKPKVFVGEQVTVGWYLYLTQPQDKYETLTEPHTDAFWSEDIASANVRNQLSLAPEVVGGRTYQVAPLFKKALFPLQAGRLTITPLEAEIAQVDFFGSAVRRQHLRSDPLTIEAVPLPKAGQPAGFDAGSVGKFEVAARADRTAVAVGEAITLTVDIKGQGNIRNVQVPRLPALDGWKTYEPKVNVTLDGGDQVAGTKSIEYLLLPERAGTTMIPSFELPYFDPAAKAYAIARSQPVRLEVAPDAAAARTAAGAATGAAPTPGRTIENVISAEIRPIRNHPTLRRDVLGTFYRSPGFLGILLVPPFGLVVGGLIGRLRERLGRDTERNRRRRVRQMVRKRLGAAEAHLEAGRTSELYIEIDRVVRDVLAARLRQPVAGLRMDELRDLLLRRGMPAEEAGRVIAELEACDLARFAPAGDDATGGRVGQRMSAALERAGELIVAIEKSSLRAEAEP
jgi:hypothetical protein